MNSNLPLLSAARNTRLQEDAISTPNAVGAFAYGATISGLGSIYNTGVDVVNFFGGDAERVDTYTKLVDVDQSWGDYYTANKTAIDTVGFIGSSIAVGGLAVKGLQAVRGAGAATGAFGRALNFTSTKQAFYLDAAVKELGAAGGSVFSQLNKNFVGALAWGTAEQTLQAGAASIAIAATMKASPMLDDKSWSEIGSEAIRDTLIGGVFGGVIGGFAMNKIYKGAATAVDERTRAYDLYSNATSKTILSPGDKAYAALDALDRLPTQVLEGDKVLDFSYKLNGRSMTSTIDTGMLADNALKRTAVKAWQDFEFVIRDSAGDEKAAAALAKSFLDMKAAGNKAGVSLEDFKKTAGGVLWNLKGASSLGEDALQDIGKVAKAKDAADILEGTTRPVKGIYNTKTGSFGFDAIPTIGDTASKSKPLTISNNLQTISAGDVEFNFKTTVFDPELPTNSVEQTARHLWASQLPQVSGDINPLDFSILSAIQERPLIATPDVTIGGRSLRDIQLAEGYSSYLIQHKTDTLKDLVQVGSPDMRELAYKLNTSVAWVQETIAGDFKPVAEGAFRKAAEYADPENLVMSYQKLDDKKSPYFAVEGLINFEARLKVATDTVKNAAASVLGADYVKMLPDFDLEGVTAATANRGGAGATLLGASNPAYTDKLGQFTQYIGVQTSKMEQAAVAKRVASEQTLLQKILKSSDDVAELAAVRNMALSTNKQMVVMGVDQGMPGTYLVDKEIARMAVDAPEDFALLKEASFTNASDKMIRIESDNVAKYVQTWVKNNGEVVKKKEVLKNAQGLSSKIDPDVFYPPPIDLNKQPFFAFVKAKEGAIFGKTDVGIITASSEKKLLELAERTKAENFDVWFKKDTENFFKAQKEYEYGKTLHETGINSELKRKGIMSEFIPNMNAESVVGEFLNYAQRSEQSLVRDAVSTRYAQTFAELEHLSSEYSKAATSQVGFISKILKKTINDPYKDYINTALNISKRSEYPILQQTNEFIDAVGTRAYRGISDAYQSMRSGAVTWDQAGPMLRRYGIGEAFKDEALFKAAQSAPDKNLVREYINKVNTIIATTQLRFDFLNPIVNTLSTPVMAGAEVASIRKLVQTDPALAAKFLENTGVAIPGQQGARIPSFMKLGANAIKNYFSEGSGALLQRYKDIGAVDDMMMQHRKMMDDMSMGVRLLPSQLGEHFEKIAEVGEKFTGNTFAEKFTRFISADIMRQLTDDAVIAGRMSDQEQAAFILTFTNRVQGNYLASQRPVLFQGTTGAAIGMFQTYQFNMLQQLFRHVEDKNTAAVATMLGLQTSIYGLNGLPFFDAVNTHLIGNSKLNPTHKDIYSLVAESIPKEQSDWLMYGTASAFPLFDGSGPALYTRGDLNPRFLTIVPTSPADVPAVSASLRFVNNLVNTASTMAGGGAFAEGILRGLEHNGLNRPLAGLAQVLNQKSTQTNGTLISGNLDLFSLASASRIMGAKPLDESVALNELYRGKAYQATDAARIEKLGVVIKTKLADGTALTDEEVEEFLGKYVASGGRAENYVKALNRWSKNANESIVNQLMEKHKSPYAQRMIEIMGGETLSDSNSMDSSNNSEE